MESQRNPGRDPLVPKLGRGEFQGQPPLPVPPASNLGRRRRGSGAGWRRGRRGPRRRQGHIPSRRAQLYCYIKVPPPPPLADGKPPVCGGGGPCGRRGSRSGLPSRPHRKEPLIVRPPVGRRKRRLRPFPNPGRGGRLRSPDLPSPAPRIPILPGVARNAICILNHPSPPPGFGKCGLNRATSRFNLPILELSRRQAPQEERLDENRGLPPSPLRAFFGLRWEQNAHNSLDGFQIPLG